ncbi:MAG TPA: UDP-GlcNAc--UDP-phosphate GlcNAc-1-phosphate transferase, partial [Daejeonella sp.]|nr:UDP-GlcNAc--UDP-phosphate GlcNAc-1-phosphate transferase [Daejeonella sp.]
FRLADRYNIIDKPNARSSHSIITLRGGGIVFPISILLYSFYSGFHYANFLLGLACISFISFWDDLHTASSKLRLFFHLMAVTFLFLQLQLFQFPVWVVIIAYVVVIGTINAYNFMDGINGITGLYSLTAILTLISINQSLNFIDMELLIFTGLALMVFLFYNFRIKARCFAGDVGSVSMAFILLFALGALILFTREFLYVLFLSVYGVDTVLTILLRLSKKENIFAAHRSHTYQLLSNERGISQLGVALIYGLLQLIINLLVIYLVNLNLSPIRQIAFALGFLTVLSVFYMLARPDTENPEMSVGK